MDSIEIMRQVAAGNITDFETSVSDVVLARLGTRIEEYKTEVASSFSDQVNAD